MNLPVFVISLARAPERRAGIVQRLNAAGVSHELVDAVDGLTLDLNALGDRPVNPAMTQGQVGCFLSHYNLWRRIAAEQIPAAVILEDDAVWEDDFWEVAAKLPALEWQWDFINCAYPRPIKAETVLCQLSDKRRLVRGKRPSWFMISYAVSLSGAGKLLKYCGPIRAGIDEQVRQYWRYGLDFYQIDPPMGWQSGADSLLGSPHDMRANKILKDQAARERLMRLYRKMRFAIYHRMRKPKRKSKRKPQRQ
ncbi:MAG: glycosyltransferase family 25 protein [Gammaproteobacteria bacterium]|nr:glycosyltransferase family 25 protein [Gammaproteobacteria bacterium]